jgi:hypothetical protein
MSQWFTKLRTYLIEHSAGDVIRAMNSLPMCPKFAVTLAFLDMWLSLDGSLRRQIGRRVEQIFALEHVPDTVLAEFIHVLEFAVLSEADMIQDIGVITRRCMASRYFAKALFFLETFLNARPHVQLTPEFLEILIRMNEMVGRQEESRAIAFAHQEHVSYPVWMTLGEWELALKLLREMDESVMPLDSLVECLAALDDWKAIRLLKDRFAQQALEKQEQLAKYFWTAEAYHGTTEDSLYYLNRTGGYGVEDCVQRSGFYIRIGDLQQASNALHLGWSYLGASVSAVEKHNRTLMKRLLFQAEQLHQLADVIGILKPPLDFQEPRHVKSSHFSFLSDDPLAQKDLYKIQSLEATVCNLDEFAFHVLSSTAKSHYSSVAPRMIEILFPDADSDKAKYATICLLEGNDALQAAKILVKTVKDDALLRRIERHIGKLTAVTAATTDELREAMVYLQSMDRDCTHLTQVLVLLAIISGDSGLSKAAAESLRQRFDLAASNLILHQILGLAVNFSAHKETTAIIGAVFENADPLDLTDISSSAVQLLAHSSPAVSGIAQLISLRLGTAFPQWIVFDLLINGTSAHASHILEEIQRSRPTAFSQITLISRGMARITNTLYDQWTARWEKAITLLKTNDTDGAFASIREMKSTLSQEAASQYDGSFLEAHAEILTKLVDADELQLDELIQLLSTIAKKQDATRVIPLSSLDDQLAEEQRWRLSMLGCRGKENDPTIVRIFNSVQRLDNGFLISMVGSDGHKMSFSLVNLPPDSRPDQQSEQFMRLLKSVAPIDKLPQRVFVEVSSSVGLIERPKGSLSLLDLVTMYHESKGKTIDNEIYEHIQVYETLNTEQRLVWLQRKPTDHAHGDLAAAMLVTSRSAMSWIHRTSNFAKSSGVLAGVSYLIGDMDTSLTAILFEKNSGCVSYSRFTVTGPAPRVPFRLTRAIISAFGMCGVRGPFQTGLAGMLKVVRKRAPAIGPFLQFAACRGPYEPGVVPKSYCSPFVEDDRENQDIDLVYDRIRGSGDIDEQVASLIASAQLPTNLILMPPPWLAWW